MTGKKIMGYPIIKAIIAFIAFQVVLGKQNGSLGIERTTLSWPGSILRALETPLYKLGHYIYLNDKYSGMYTRSSFSIHMQRELQTNSVTISPPEVKDPNRKPLNEAVSFENMIGRPCQFDEDCSTNGYITCQKKEIETDDIDGDGTKDNNGNTYVSSHSCRHKKLFPIFVSEIVGVVIFAIQSIMSSTAGIGGGSGVVSILFIFFRFTTKEALGLSNCFVFITGIIKFFVSLKMKHPTIKHRPVNEYNLILILMPSMLLGSFFGATVSAAIPGILQRGGMVIVLIYAVFESLCKGIEIYQKESKQKAEEEAAKKAAEAVEIKPVTEDEDLASNSKSIAEDEASRPKTTKFLVMSTTR